MSQTLTETQSSVAATATVEHWIDGASVAGDSDRTGPVYNPALGIEQKRVRFASTDDVDTAVQAAARAFPGWRDTSIAKRQQVMFAFRELLNARSEELAAILTSEHGKVLLDAAGEIARGLEVVELACAMPGYTVAVDALLEHPTVRSISFVGSTPIAQYIYSTATANGKRVQALGGAKNHMLVLPDADLDLAADAAVNAGFGS